MIRYAITDRARFAGDDTARQSALIEQAARLAAAKVDFLQLREKDLAVAELAVLGRRLFAELKAQGSGPGRRPKLLINSRVDVAVAVAADGVHLTSQPGSLTPIQVRSLYAAAELPPPIVSLSCHTLAEVIAARGLQPEGGLCFAPDPVAAPDLILFGPLFEKVVADPEIPNGPAPSVSRGTGVAAGSGLELLGRACAVAAPVPVLALGGVTQVNTAACLTAGAAGIAAIRLFIMEQVR